MVQLYILFVYESPNVKYLFVKTSVSGHLLLLFWRWTYSKELLLAEQILNLIPNNVYLGLNITFLVLCNWMRGTYQVKGLQLIVFMLLVATGLAVCFVTKIKR